MNSFSFYSSQPTVFTHLCKKISPLLLILLSGFYATATTYNVTTTADGTGVTTLRGAITAANGSVGPHIINVPAGTYNLTMGQIRYGDLVGQNITIQGTGGIATINMAGTGTNRNRIFNINYNSIASVTAYVKNIKFTNGYAGTTFNAGDQADPGGAILCGGPNNLIDISNCVFENNTINTTNGASSYGGAISCLVSATLNIDGCTFTNNIDPLINGRPGSGAAIYYDIYSLNGVAASGSVSITNSTFTNNSVGAGGNGGAINIEGATLDAGQNLTVNILRNTFINNSATATGRGGAINIKTDRSSCTVSYNRFVGNTASFGSGICVSDDDGNVDATNNWWGCNSGATGCADKAEQIAGNNGNGILTSVPYLILKTTASSSAACTGVGTSITTGFTLNSAGTTIPSVNLSAFFGVPVSYSVTAGTISNAQTSVQSNGTAMATYTGSTAGTGTVNAIIDNVSSNDATARASLTINAGATINSHPVSATSGVCTGNSISFSTSASGSGTLSYQWYKGTTALMNGTTGTGSIISGATTPLLTISNASINDNAANYNVVVSSSTGCTPATSNNTALTITPPATSTTTSSATKTISATNTIISNSSCALIAVVAPSGASPVSGNVTATVTVQNSVQVSSNGSPYLPRYYDITPVANAATATATVTLFFTQSEFTAYNAYAGHGLNLPVDATDAANYRSNVRIYVFHGSPNGGGNFPGPTEEINPADANIIWNSTYSRWEVTFPTVGFSRYYLASAGNLILPLNSITLTGHTDGNTAWLNWKAIGEREISRYEIERSVDGTKFTTIGQVSFGGTYSFTDIPTDKTVYYYRLKAIDQDGRYTYSSIIAISLKKVSALVQVLPNPFKEKLLLNISSVQTVSTEIRLMDMSGKVLVRKIVILPAGTSALTLDKLEGLTTGTYLLQVKNERMNETVKVMKAE